MAAVNMAMMAIAFGVPKKAQGSFGRRASGMLTTSVCGVSSVFPVAGISPGRSRGCLHVQLHAGVGMPELRPHRLSPEGGGAIAPTRLIHAPRYWPGLV